MCTYRTIFSTSEGNYSDKGSRFLAFVFPCESEKEVKEIIQKLRQEHPKAVHVCSAFRLGTDKKLYRSSDDGEPAHSAGPPIMGQIEAFDLTNVLIAVVRYYGGVNLGVGGLIKAYRTATQEALNKANIIEKEVMQSFTLTCDYASLSAALRFVKSHGNLVEQTLENTCVLVFEVPIKNKENVLKSDWIRKIEL
jgi:uncharacterized YigZ family protein